MPTTDRTLRRPNKIYAPWPAAVAAALNDYQDNPRITPAFTCPAGHTGTPVLIADQAGWGCPAHYCGHRQDWAWLFMARPRVPEESTP
jgi:hypothetical protein